MTHSSGQGAMGLERSCGESQGWIRQTESVGGVEHFAAWFPGVAYAKHRHDTYAISVTSCGIQTFDYRGETRVSRPGQVVVLHPDEVHDGRAGSDDGFGYRQIYVDPARILEAVRSFDGPVSSLPFVQDPVVTSAPLQSAIDDEFHDRRDALAIDDLVLRVALTLVALDPACRCASKVRHLDNQAIERAKSLLNASTSRPVRSSELEAETGLSRYDLARQFRAAVGTSPYRYLLMRRLEKTRTALSGEGSIVDLALDAGFADQAHFTRAFVRAYGIPPGRYRALAAVDQRSVGESIER